jgi:hypothetical protein
VAASVASLATAVLALAAGTLETRGTQLVRDFGPLDGFGVAVVAIWFVTWGALFARWHGRSLRWYPVIRLATLATLIAIACLVFAFCRTIPVT